MSVKSKNFHKARGRHRADRPFDPAVWKRAESIAARYRIVIWHEDGEYYGRGLELPFVMNDGATPDACVKAVREILSTTVAAMIERGETPPPPASDAKRTEQVNVRLTPEEKLLLEQSARQGGFDGISDFMRAKAIG
jgi:predicted RNase H-like HicB family nuclease